MQLYICNGWELFNVGNYVLQYLASYLILLHVHLLQECCLKLLLSAQIFPMSSTLLNIKMLGWSVASSKMTDQLKNHQTHYGIKYFQIQVFRISLLVHVQTE